MRFYFINIPGKCPSTGGYVYDDIRVDMNETGIEMEQDTESDEYSYIF